MGVFERTANFLLSRLPWFRTHYEGWGKGKKIFIAFLLYLIVLPVIPIIIALVMYIHDPQGFKKSKAFPILSALIVMQLVAFGFIASRPSTTTTTSTNAESVATSTAGETQTSGQTSRTVSTRTTSGSKSGSAGNSTNGRYFKNCDAAFKVGVRNIPRGDESYRPRLDHDGDGIACEK